MMKARRFLSLILAALMLAGCVACSEKTTEDDNKNNVSQITPPSADNNEETETEKLYLDDLPEDLKFDATNVRFLSSYTSKSITLLEEDDESDLVNEAVWRRNLKIEERLGVNIELATGAVTGYGEFNNVVNNSFTSSSDDYDILVGHTRFNINLAANGVLKNLNNINYLDFEKPYWSKDYTESISYNGNHYWATGDLSIEYIKYIYAMFVNSVMWNDHYADTNLYDIVKEGKWTLDTLNQYAENTYVDENGNGEVDDNDSFGVIMQKGHVLNGMFFAADVKYTDYDENGTPVVVLNSEHTIDVFDKLHAMFYSSSYGRMLANEQFDTLPGIMFPNRRLLFCPNTFEFAENEKIRAMEDDFFIIPLPKFDENQEKYRSNQYDGVPIYGIMITANGDKMDMFGATLEAMCSLSSTIVIPTYYDKALKNKYSRDAQTADMIDIVHDSVTSDFSFAWGDTVGMIYNIFYDNIQNNEIASRMKSTAKIWAKNMERLIKKLDENAAN